MTSEVRRWRELRRKGWSYAKIANEANRAACTVRRHAGDGRRSDQADPREVAIWRELYEDGLTIAAIARFRGVAASTVHIHVKPTAKVRHTRRKTRSTRLAKLTLQARIEERRKGGCRHGKG